MKKLFAVFTILFATTIHAATVGQAKFVITNTPSDGNTLTYRGVTRTWKTTVTTSATQVQIGGTAAISANNLANALGQYPFDTVSHLVQESTTNITIIADAGLTVTASLVGTWGTVTVTTTTLTQGPISFPLVTASTATRTNDANNLLAAFAYASTAFGASSAVLSNFMNLTAAQTVSGLKTFTAANTYSNAAQLFNGGTANGVTLTNAPLAWVTNLYVRTYAYFNGGLEITNAGPAIRFYDSLGAANQKRTIITADSLGWNVYFDNDALSAGSNVFSIDRDSTYGALKAVFRTRLTADYIYNTILSNSLSTNMVMIHSAAALIASPMFTGPTVVSNTAPIFTFNETDAGSNLKQFQFRSEAGVLSLYMGTDAGTVAANQKLWSVERPGLSELTADSRYRFFGPVQFDSTVAFTGANVTLDGYLRTGTGLVVGSTSETPPQDGNLYLVDAASGPLADPITSGVVYWSDGGVPFYRSFTANEGAGQANYVHNRPGMTQGAGTDYTLTSSTAAVDFGTTDPNFTAPTSGTYLIWADVAITAGGTANDDYRAKLRNTTSSTDLTGADQSITYLGASQVGTMKIQTYAPLNASDVVALYAHNNTAARGTVNSARTRIGYVRLY